MDVSNFNALVPAAGIITTIGGAYMTVRKIARDAEKRKKEQVAEILHAAKEEDALVVAKLEAKIIALQTELSNLEANVNKDMDHLRETYNGEIRVLGEKIEDLRSDLKNQHGQLVQLLTEMIKKNN